MLTVPTSRRSCGQGSKGNPNGSRSQVAASIGCSTDVVQLGEKVVASRRHEHTEAGADAMGA